MIAEMEIKTKCPLGYSVTYKIWEVVREDKDEKEFVEKCHLALDDCLRVSGINKRNIQF